MNSDFNTWLIAEASKPHESKMLQLVGGDETRRTELTGRLLSGIEKPDLLMYHVDVLHSHDGHRAYELLTSLLLLCCWGREQIFQALP